MSDLISKALLCGLGLASLTKDAIQKSVKDLVEESKISEAEGRRLVKDLQRRSTRAQKTLEKHVDAGVHQVLTSLDLTGMIIDRLQGTKPARKRKPKAKARRRGGASKTSKR
jgi:polyhydroxyalkanoate synthesis regulator phasin